MTYDASFHYPEAREMEWRPLGKTDMKVSKLGLGGGAFGNIYGKVTQETVNEMVLKALKSGINFIDTAPWYGQGVSEERLGVALQNVPREKYFIATKVGRYQIEPLNEMFDFSVDKVEKSVKDSLRKLRLSYVDLIQVHDIEFSASIEQIVRHTLPTLMRLKKEGLVRYIGITGYNLGVLKKVVRLSTPGTIDTVLSYARCNLINQDLMDDLEFFKSRGIGLINASPLALGLLTNQVDPPDWHIAPDLVKQCVKKAAKLCQDRGEDLAMISNWYSLNMDSYVATTLSSMIDDDQLARNLKAATSKDPMVGPDLLSLLKRVFDDLPISQWENLEVTRYWKQMKDNEEWKQNLDCNID